MEKFALVTNSFGVQSPVPLWKAKEMMLSKEIEDYELIEVDYANNLEAPQTQRDFENSLNSKNIVDTKEKELQELKAEANKLLVSKDAEIEELKAQLKAQEVKTPEVKTPEVKTK